jgi:hypothetical protein
MKTNDESKTGLGLDGIYKIFHSVNLVNPVNPVYSFLTLLFPILSIKFAGLRGTGVMRAKAKAVMMDYDKGIG